MKFISIDKSSFLILAFFSVLVFFSVQVPMRSATAAQPDKILEGAKKEGKLMWYTSTTLDVYSEVVKKFREKYPFIEVSVNRASSEAVLTRILAEAQMGKHIFDVATTPGAEGLTLKKRGFLAKYLSPESQFYPDGFKDPEGYWTDFYITLNVMGYNTKLVSPQDAPGTWNDLLKPKWQGKIGLDTKAFEWFGYMLKFMGRKNGLEYMEKLARQNIRFRTGKALLVQLMAAGEHSLVLTSSTQIEEMKAKGAPADWCIEPIVPSIHPIGISAYASHPNAAKLFIDFALSREIQEMQVLENRASSRKDVKPARMKKEMKILTPDINIADSYAENVKLYRSILMKK